MRKVNGVKLKFALGIKVGFEKPVIIRFFGSVLLSVYYPKTGGYFRFSCLQASETRVTPVLAYYPTQLVVECGCVNYLYF